MSFLKPQAHCGRNFYKRKSQHQHSFKSFYPKFDAKNDSMYILFAKICPFKQVVECVFFCLREIFRVVTGFLYEDQANIRISCIPNRDEVELWDVLRSAVSNGSITFTDTYPQQKLATSPGFPQMEQIHSRKTWRSSGQFAGSRKRNIGPKVYEARQYMKISPFHHSGKKMSTSFLQRKRMKQVDRIYSKWVDL